MAWSNGVIRLMATFVPEAICTAALSGAKRSQEVKYAGLSQVGREEHEEDLSDAAGTRSEDVSVLTRRHHKLPRQPSQSLRSAPRH